jgi:nitroreductase
MADEIGLFKAIYNMRAMRRLKPDPVPDELIRKIIDAGLRAPTGGDTQNWRFIVVKDPEIKQKIQAVYKRAFEVVITRYRSNPPPPGKTEAQKQRMLKAVEYLTDHFHEAPVMIVCCLINDMAKAIGLAKMSGASIYPSVQNMLLAARALGLGSVLTTRHLLYEKEVNEALGLPANAETFAILPIGWPMGKFGAVSREPVEKVTFFNKWGQPLPS